VLADEQHESDTVVRGIDFRAFIALIVVFVWAILAISTLLTQNYTALGAVTPVMMIVVGFLFGYRREVQLPPVDELQEHKRKRPKNDLSDW
jgi:hypothetical protein